MQELLWVLSNLNSSDLVDIFIVALLFYFGSFLFRGTQATALFRGILIIMVVLFLVAGILNLRALGWLLANGVTLLVIAIPVIFQPELRRALEQVGRGNLAFFSRHTPETARDKIIAEIVRAVDKLSERRHGALIVLERQSSLEEFIRTGVHLNSDVTADLLLTIFWPKTELHDGAVIINSAGKIAAAAAVLPLTASRNLPNPKMGTRHRASLGISEVGDAICVVVSEETGKVALTSGGKMVSRLDLERLRTILKQFYDPETDEGSRRRWLQWPSWLRSSVMHLADGRKRN